MLGIVRAADGWIGINCLTGQHWLDVCAMVGLPEFGEHQLAIMLGGPERDEFFAKAQPWLDSMAVADLVELEPGHANTRRAGHSKATSILSPRSTPSAGFSSKSDGTGAIRPTRSAVPAIEDAGRAAIACPASGRDTPSPLG